MYFINPSAYYTYLVAGCDGTQGSKWFRLCPNGKEFKCTWIVPKDPICYGYVRIGLLIVIAGLKP